MLNFPTPPFIATLILAIASHFFPTHALASTPLQSYLDINQVTELPTMGETCDHASVAVSDRGDIFAVWQSQSEDPSVGTQVEGMFFRRKPGSLLWEKPSSQMLLGDPRMPLPQFENKTKNINCKKADVVAVGDNFIVSWTRFHKFRMETGQIEAVMIQVTDGVAKSIALNDGVGFHVDEVDCSARNDGVSDLCFQPNLHPGSEQLDQAFVVFSSFSNTQQEPYQDYIVKLAHIDFRTTANSLPPKITKFPQLDILAPFDISDPNPNRPHKILPDIVALNENFIAVAHDQNLLDSRTGSGTGSEGSIQLNVYQVSEDPDMDAQLVSTESDLVRDRLFRRPTLVGPLTGELNNTFLLTWNDSAPDFSTTNYFLQDFTFDPLNINGPILIREGSFQSKSGQEILPDPFRFWNGATVHAGLSTSKLQGSRWLLFTANEKTNFRSQPFFPDEYYDGRRSASAVIKSKADDLTTVTVFEGEKLTGGDNQSIFLVIRK